MEITVQFNLNIKNKQTQKKTNIQLKSIKHVCK